MRAENSENLIAILEHGAEVDVRDRDDDTPLHEAARSGKPDHISILVDAGADLAARDKPHGGTALHWAARYGSAANVRALLAAGADVDASALNGATPLHWAAASSGNGDKIVLLANEGGDVNQPDQKGNTPLHEAAIWGKGLFVDTLMDVGANGAIPNGEGQVPWELARERSLGAETFQRLKNSAVD